MADIQHIKCKTQRKTWPNRQSFALLIGNRGRGIERQCLNLHRKFINNRFCACAVQMLLKMAVSATTCSTLCWTLVHTHFYLKTFAITINCSDNCFRTCVHETKIELLTFDSKILLHLSCHKNGISGSFTFHECKLHVINLISAAEFCAQKSFLQLS